jgi:hypothetical protein
MMGRTVALLNLGMLAIQRSGATTATAFSSIISAILSRASPIRPVSSPHYPTNLRRLVLITYWDKDSSLAQRSGKNQELQWKLRVAEHQRLLHAAELEKRPTNDQYEVEIAAREAAEQRALVAEENNTKLREQHDEVVAARKAAEERVITLKNNNTELRATVADLKEALETAQEDYKECEQFLQGVYNERDLASRTTWREHLRLEKATRKLPRSMQRASRNKIRRWLTSRLPNAHYPASSPSARRHGKHARKSSIDGLGLQGLG